MTIAEAAKIIKDGGLCVIPTETVYGIACRADSPEAAARLFALKNRPPEKQISLLIPGESWIFRLAQEAPGVRRLAKDFMPGALTLVLKSRRGAWLESDTVGLRVPDHPIALALLRECGAPLACTSANSSGQPAPRAFSEAAAFAAAVGVGILDGGGTSGGVESTVLDMTVSPPKILRRGAVSKARLSRSLGAALGGISVLGLTGGSGAGKTTTLRALEALGALVLDCDALYHELLVSNGELLSALDARFPGVISGGKLDRAALGAVVFRDAAALADLNKITHGFVIRECLDRIRSADAQKIPLAIIDAIALIESGLGALCDVTAAVLAPREARLERIMTRDGISRERAELRLGAQKPDEFFAAGCDLVLTNDYSDPAEFQAECLRTFKHMLEGI
ncbi:MAG: threonylcarbamoyl-AMP synthase [Oscillospiraceae bacterium]|nr:threonylcarbamoyl-AMP synthase [Oscillospiraceae bacterium]